MKKIKTPLRRHSGLKIKISQKYGNTSLNNWYQANGINNPFHNGVDLILDNNPAKTFGTPCVACFDGVVVKTTWDSPLSTKGNGITIQSNEFFYSGEKYIYQAVYWHLSEITKNIGEKIKEGDVVGYVGNSGLVNPRPTQSNPFGGSHLHFMLFVFKWVNGSFVLQNYNNGVNGAIDPLPYIDDLQGEEGEDTGIEKDLPVFKHFFSSFYDLILRALKIK